jgi:L-malate glycosyltransferase
MKILVASHTYIVDLNCEKLRALANLEPDIQVKIVVPKRWRPGGVQNQIIETKAKHEGNFSVVPIANFSENNQGLLSFSWEIIPLLQQFKPDIIHVEQGVKSLAYAQLITLNRWLGLKAKNTFFTWWNLPYQNKFPVDLLEKYNLNSTDGIISGNQDGADILREHGYGGAIKVLPQLGVDEVLFTPQSQPELAQKLQIDRDELTIGFVGRFVPEKGILTLIRALIPLQNLRWKLLLLGRGELKETILKQVDQLGIKERVIIVESVPHHIVPQYINLMDILVLPSETTTKFKTLTSVGWKEQFGHVLIEAMACKVAVIGSDSGEIPHVIGDAGLIFPEGNAEQLSQILAKAIANPASITKLAEKGYRRSIEKYTNKALAREQLNFYRELIEP